MPISATSRTVAAAHSAPAGVTLESPHRVHKLTPPPKPPAHQSARQGPSDPPALPERRDPELDIETRRDRSFAQDVAAARQAAATSRRDVEEAKGPKAAGESADTVEPTPPKTLIFGRYEPLWAAGAAVGFVVSALATGTLIWAMVAGTLPGGAPPTASSTPVASVTASPSALASAAAAQTTPSPDRREAEIRKLARVLPAKRTAAETVAVARLELADEVDELQRLRERLRSDPALGRDPATLKMLLAAARDDARALDALAVIAELPGPESADLLYEVWTATAARTRTTAVAEQLVHSRDVLPKASPALRVALDLRRAETCEQLADILPRAIEVGDRRSLHLLGKLNRPRIGCGPKGKQDCHACVRHTEPLTDAIHATLSRQAPRY